MILSDFLLAIRGFTKFTDPEVQTDALLISYLRMAEEKISSKLRCADMVQIDTAILTTARTRMPDDFRDMDFMRKVDGKPVRYLARDKFYEADNVTTSHFTTSGNFLIVGGTFTSVEVEMHYFGDVEPLTATTESWLARRYPRILTFATMEVASLGMVDEERAQNWGGMADGLIDELNAAYKMSIAKGSKLSTFQGGMG